MARSHAHRFGQIVGDMLEEAIVKYLKPLARKHSLYLDHRKPRNARNGKKEVVWTDANGNKHKLDVVLEKGGTEDTVGDPRAFIEIAWRKYTKHSKNKVQEISAALRPLIDKYYEHRPFFGAIIAGTFTDTSIRQLKSEGFEVIYIPENTIEVAFSFAGLDAHWNENTSEAVIQRKIEMFERLNRSEILKIQNKLLSLSNKHLLQFSSKLCESLKRKIHSITIVSIFGNEVSFATIDDACDFIGRYIENASTAKFLTFKVHVRYSNGDYIDAKCASRTDAIAFLRKIQ